MPRRSIAEALGLPVTTVAPTAGESTANLQKNVALFWSWQDASNNRDVAGMLRHYHPEATVVVPGAEDLPGGGRFHGLDAIRDHLQASVDAFDTEPLTPETLKVDAVGDFVFARAWAKAVARATGLAFEALCMLEFEFKDGLIRYQTIVVDTAEIRRSVLPDASDPGASPTSGDASR